MKTFAKQIGIDFEETPPKKKTTDPKQLVEELIVVYKQLDSFFDELTKLFGDPMDSPLWDINWNIFTNYCDAVSLLIGDTYDNLNWYIFDNACGANNLEVMIDGELFKIGEDIDDFFILLNHNSDDTDL